MQTTLYKIHIFCIFYQKYLHISKKSSTFAPELKIYVLNLFNSIMIRNNSQMVNNK